MPITLSFLLENSEQRLIHNVYVDYKLLELFCTT